MEFTIRSPNKDDFSKVERIHKEFTGELDNSVQLKNFRKYIYLQSNLIKIATWSKEVYGYVFGYQESERKSLIYSLYVKPKYQRCKIGSSLFYSIEKSLSLNSPKLEYITVRIPRKYLKSINFFKKHGFKKIASINYYVKHDLSFSFTVNPDIVIKPIDLTKNELKLVYTLETQCFPKYWQITENEFQDLISSEQCSLYLAYINNILVGYNYNTLSDSSPEGHYVRIATHPDYRMKGVATTLTAKAFEYFKKNRVQRILLSTYANNKITNQLYQKWGFKKMGQELFMAKEFKEL